MPELEVLRPTPGDAWRQLLRRSAEPRFHQHPGYHALAESRGEGRGRLFLFRHRDEFVALPLLLRSIEPPAGCGRPLADATSVYGYGGPFARLVARSGLPLAGFHDALRVALRERGVVAVFSRLHPLSDQPPLLEGTGAVVTQGRTVALDLRLAEQQRRAAYRTNHRRDIRRLERAGLVVREDRELELVPRLACLYEATMDRLGAADPYRFGPDYFRALFAIERPGARLFACHEGDRVVCAGVFFVWRGLIEYHLSGTTDDYHGRAPLKLLLDRVASWGAERGERVMHLGGGLGSNDDSLLHFKRGFGGELRPFRTWRWIVRATAYERLCRQAGEPATGAARPEAYFPAFRRPRHD